MYLPNASSTNHYYTSEQLKSPKARIGEKMLKICLIPLALTFQLLGALLSWALYVAALAFLILLAALFLIGALVLGKRKSYSTSVKQAVPFCRQRSEGETSVLFIFLVLGAMHISSSFLGLRRREISSQSKVILTTTEAETATEFLYE